MKIKPFIFFFFSVTLTFTTVSAARIFIDPSYIYDTSLGPGTEFSINVNVSGVDNLYGFEFKLYWDKDVLEYKSNTTYLGELWDERLPWKYEVGQDYYYLSYSGRRPILVGYSGSVSLVTIKFRVKNRGGSPLELRLSKWSDNTSQYIPHSIENGTFLNTKCTTNPGGVCEVYDSFICSPNGCHSFPWCLPIDWCAYNCWDSGMQVDCNPGETCICVNTVLCDCDDGELCTDAGCVSTTTTTTTIPPGGGCPILFVYDGNSYVKERKSRLHSQEGIDVIDEIVLETKPIAEGGVYSLSLRETTLPEHSYIDNVRLFVIDSEGKKEAQLISAVHSRYGDVTAILAESDDVRTDTKVFDSIELKFLAPELNEPESFLFTIEGYNPADVLGRWRWTFPVKLDIGPINSLIQLFARLFSW